MNDFVVLSLLIIGMIYAFYWVANRSLALTSQLRLNNGSSKEFWCFKDIRDNMLIVDETQYRAIIKVQPIDHLLKMEAGESVDLIFRKSLEAMWYSFEIIAPTQGSEINTYYIILKHDYIRVGSENTYWQVAKELESRAFSLVENLAVAGFKARVLGTPAITEFVRNFYGQSSANKRTSSTRYKLTLFDPGIIRI
ncbi:MAG: hypothetical protein M0Z31_13360 [Clostridia bacterium]|nr:hypothetical protein [Clostridia bacterium]